jgi:hypothetical protein
MSRLFAYVVFALITTAQIVEAEESRSPVAQEIIIRGKFVAPSASAAAAHYLPVVSIAIAYDPQYGPGKAISTNSVRTELIGLVDTGSDGGHRQGDRRSDRNETLAIPRNFSRRK